MIEQTIAQYLADKTSLTLGTDLFVDHLPAGVQHGVFVKMVEDSIDYGAMPRATVEVLITYRSYYDTAQRTYEIRDVLIEMVGIDGWASGGRAIVNNYGQNSQGDNLMSVMCDIFYEGG